MSAATPTGAELRARRERLGLSTCDAMQAASAHAHRLNPGNFGVSHSEILGAESSDAPAKHWPSTYHAYAAALTAEEQRRSAATLAEPVAPEGVTVSLWDDDDTWSVSMRTTSGTLMGFALVALSGLIEVRSASGASEATAFLRFVADLADCRAAQHAAGEQQRRLDKVQAAEEAHEEAMRHEATCIDARARAKVVADRTFRALADARKAAGL